MKPSTIIPLALLGALVPFTLLLGTPASPGTSSQSTPEEISEEQPMTASLTFSASGYDITRLSDDTISELASKLDPETFEVTQRSGTERPFCGTLLDNKKDGFYACAVCGLPLFSSEHKFTSGTGWPSFNTEYDPLHVARITDTTMGMVRTEIECVRCGSHLGHVFPDGPPPTGERHCLNSVSLSFVEDGKDVPMASRPALETAYFAGGCFWGIEHYYQKGPGVIDAASGYMNGDTEYPTYKDVCTTDSGHAEAVRVLYDPSVITYEQLLMAFFMMHDPTQLNRQGPDRGTQYRSGIYTASDAQLEAARAMVKSLEDSKAFPGTIVTEIEPAQRFYPAEEFHQDYIETTGRACHVQDPWPALRETISGTSDQPDPGDS